jgi:hypothetical protein
MEKLVSTSHDSNSYDDVIRASEIGEYVHCNRAWWLGHVQGVPNANRAQMETGTEQHRAHGRRVWRATMMQNVALVLIVVAIVAAAILVVRILNLI